MFIFFYILFLHKESLDCIFRVFGNTTVKSSSVKIKLKSEHNENVQSTVQKSQILNNINFFDSWCVPICCIAAAAGRLNSFAIRNFTFSLLSTHLSFWKIYCYIVLTLGLLLGLRRMLLWGFHEAIAPCQYLASHGVRYLKKEHYENCLNVPLKYLLYFLI